MNSEPHRHNASCTWLTVPEAAEWIKVNKSTLYRYIRERKLKVSRPGGVLIRICVEELGRLGEDNSCDHPS